MKKTQRLWIPYRDAWVAFAAVRYPKFSAEPSSAWLSAERTRQLGDLVRS